MADLIDIAKQSVMALVILLVVYFLGLQLQGLGLEEGVSRAYVDFYSGLIPLSILSIIALVVFKVRYFSVFGEYLGTAAKFGIIIVWTLFIVFISFSGQQVVPVPRASVESFQITAQNEMYLSSVVPGVLEDLNYLVGLPMIFAVILLLMLEFGAGIEPGAGVTIGVMVLAAFVASIGYNVWVVPGFASAHVPSYGATNPALFGAFMFSFGQSLVYMVTGLFLPLAHIIHNAIIYTSAQSALSVGPLGVVGI